MLSSAQAESFEREGFLVCPKVLSDEIIQSVISDIEAEIDRQAAIALRDRRLRDPCSTLPFERRLIALHQQDPTLVWQINRGQLSGDGIFELMRSDTLLGLLRPLLGNEIVASSGYRVRPKMPGFFHCVLPWHQDSAVFESYCDDELIITCWIALVDATIERGCLQMLPQAHSRLLPHIHVEGRPNVEIDPAHLPDREAVTIEVERGSVVMFTNRTPHRSFDNRSNLTRWSIDLRYQALSTPHNLRHLDSAARDRKTTFGGCGCFPPEADLLIASDRHPELVTRSAEEFRRIRESHRGPDETPDHARWSLGRKLGDFRFEGSRPAAD